jgi:hypothetical protein
VIQTQNNYDREVFNGDIGQVVRIDPDERELVIRFEEREVLYDFNELDELSLAYAITIHKGQGSESHSGHAALPPLVGEPGLHRNDPGQNTLGSGRPEKGAHNRSSQR